MLHTTSEEKSNIIYSNPGTRTKTHTSYLANYTHIHTIIIYTYMMLETQLLYSFFYLTRVDVTHVSHIVLYLSNRKEIFWNCRNYMDVRYINYKLVFSDFTIFR